MHGLGTAHKRPTNVRWIERQAEGKFKLRYVGPTEYVQWGALLQRLA